MKRFLVAILFSFLFLVIWAGISLVLPRSAFAQGYCRCNLSANDTCVLKTNHCDTNYRASCTGNLNKCNNGSGSCSCVYSPPPPTATVKPPTATVKPPTATVKPPTATVANLTPVLISGGVSSPTCGAEGGINTAIGCIPTNDPQAFTSFLLRWGIGIGGGIAMLLIIYSGFLIMTSSGDPRKMQAGKELLTAAIGGIIFLAASTYILSIVGVEILKIPGL